MNFRGMLNADRFSCDVLCCMSERCQVMLSFADTELTRLEKLATF